MNLQILTKNMNTALLIGDASRQQRMDLRALRRRNRIICR